MNNDRKEIKTMVTSLCQCTVSKYSHCARQWCTQMGLAQTPDFSWVPHDGGYAVTKLARCSANASCERVQKGEKIKMYVMTPLKPFIYFSNASFKICISMHRAWWPRRPETWTWLFGFKVQKAQYILVYKKWFGFVKNRLLMWLFMSAF